MERTSQKNNHIFQLMYLWKHVFQDYKECNIVTLNILYHLNVASVATAPINLPFISVVTNINDK